MVEIIVGTCGYDYPEWVGEGRFYPASLARDRRAWLTYYASQFRAVELNFTYYGETNQDQLATMLRRVDPAHGLYILEGGYLPQPGFQFFIKAYSSMTHHIDSDWRQAARKFRQDLAPLSEGGALGGILVQLPSRLHACQELASYLEGLAAELQGLPVLVELRHRSWGTDVWRSRLAQLPLVICMVDAPRDAQLPLNLEERLRDETSQPQLACAPSGPGVRNVAPTTEQHSSGFSYLRLHGRQEGQWWTGDNASRYEYNYSTMELARLATRLNQTSQARAYAMFNNHRHGAAAENALELAGLLQRNITGKG